MSSSYSSYSSGSGTGVSSNDSTGPGPGPGSGRRAPRVAPRGERTQELEVAPGAHRELTAAEKERLAPQGGRESFCCGCLDRGYKYVVTEPYRARARFGSGPARAVVVPAGFLCDGSTGGPDTGSSWVFHDWLYATHEWEGGAECTRQEADQLMYRILKQEGQGFYAWGFNALAGCDCLGLFGKAWESSGSKGREEFMLRPR